jgi:MoxR-like ATPase
MAINNTPSADVIEQIKEESERLNGLSIEVGKVIVGQRDIINFMIIALLCDGHILLEGVPGVAKTTMIKAFTNAIGGTFQRIQFTPDLLPADLIGTLIYNQKTQDFETKKGPIFANLVLADEINRAPAKVQAALLEAMQERQVTIGSTTYQLDRPFLVFATQNPIEQEGTYSLPEAQVDRFLFKLLVLYPNLHEERELLRRSLDVNQVHKIINKDTIFKAQELVKAVYVDEKIIDYIVSIVFATRMPAEYKLKDIASYINYGVSPRATLALLHASKARAFLKKRHFVTPDDVKSIAHPVLRHRLGLTYEAEAQGISPDQIITQILNVIPAP